MKDPCTRSRLLYAGLACGAALTAWAAAHRLSRTNNREKRLLEREAEPPAELSTNKVELQKQRSLKVAAQSSKKQLYRAGAVLAASVLADSTMEHYRGCYFRPEMYLAPAVSTLALAESFSRALKQGASNGKIGKGVFWSAVLTGIAGTGFHLYNVGKREGSFNWVNLFYGAPLGAPAALTLSGLSGLAASQLEKDWEEKSPKLLGRPAGKVLSGLSAMGMMGTVLEAWLLHFRGAFQDPFQYVPLAVPPLSTAALIAATLRPSKALLKLASATLKATGLIGVAGLGFHIYGIHRNMGGLYNWSQMVLQGPPLPAPLGFTGLAFSSLSALTLIEEERKWHEYIQKQVPELQRPGQVEQSLMERADQESGAQATAQRSREKVLRFERMENA